MLHVVGRGLRSSPHAGLLGTHNLLLLSSAHHVPWQPSFLPCRPSNCCTIVINSWTTDELPWSARWGSNYLSHRVQAVCQDKSRDKCICKTGVLYFQAACVTVGHLACLCVWSDSSFYWPTDICIHKYG